MFPAMHHYAIDGEEARAVYEVLARHGAPAFVHCGLLVVKLRDLLGLPRVQDIQYANPLALIPAANAHPEVPFIIAFPFLLEPGIVVEGRTRNIDVWPTLLDLLGLPPLPDADGRSLLPSILAGAEGQEEFSDDPESPLAIAHLDRSWGRPGNPSRPIVAVSRGPHRLLYAPTRDGGTMERLFDREESESEQRNVAEDQPEVVSELREHAIDYLNTSPISWGEEPPEIDLDEMQLNQLRALGYAVDQ